MSESLDILREAGFIIGGDIPRAAKRYVDGEGTIDDFQAVLNEQVLKHIEAIDKKIAAAIRASAEEANHSSKSIPSLESDVLKLRKTLNKAISAIGSLERESLGVGGSGITHWSIRDELLEDLNQVLNETERKS